MDIATVDELLSTTRAVRKRLDLERPVGREVILECIQLAMQAPTASNTQDWRWLVITDADKRAAIAEIYSSIGAQYLAYAADNATDPQTQRVYQSAMSLTTTLAKVPVHVIPCLEQRIDGAELGVAAAAWASIIPAGWSFLLALRSRGLGSVWTTMHLFKEKEVAELARHSTHRHAGRALPGRLHDRHRLPAGRAAARGVRHLLGQLGRLVDAVLHGAIPRRCAAEESLASVASASAAERAQTAGARVAGRQHGNPERR